MDRFWRKIHKTRRCWLWTGAVKSNGYGNLRVGTRTVMAHRYSYELHNGPIPGGLHVCHRCDNPLCVRPGHLFLGTRVDNQQDMGRKRRHPNPKLSGRQVTAIRRARARGETCEAIGDRFGVSKLLISRAARGVTYAWVK